MSKDWPELADRLRRFADELEELVRVLPATTDPDPEQAKMIRSATGRISARIGTLKRRVGVGTKQ